MTAAMAPTDATFPIRVGLREAELDGAEALVREVGWNQVVADWRIFLALGRVYAVRTVAGRLVATAATLPHGDRFAWISMVLVAADHRRRGIATRLLRRAMDDLVAEKLVPVLDATPDGRPIYRALGFEDSWSYHRLTRPAPRPPAEPPPAPDGVTIAPITDTAWPALCRHDAKIFGADRSGVLARLRGRLPAVELLAARGGRIVGFLLGRDGRAAGQLGPLIAEDDATALALLGRGLAAVDGPLYVDLADAKTGVAAWLERAGFAPQRPFTRMQHARRASFDDPARTFAVVGPEFG